ncbi:MAG: HAD family hydrolase [Phycisphaerae bacterium]|nr:HAD family hydrolase [Phycisphaerae bacterium]NUQ48072.1 HAD family hydrolase [Phycisphaerae bacterium]
MQRAVFLDRDGTIIEDMHYSGDPARVRLLPGAAGALCRLRAAGYRLIVVTNQSGIARGLLSVAQLAEVHRRMERLLAAEGATLDAIYYCPYLAGVEAVVEEYRRDSDLRKPGPGMLIQAAREWNIDLQRSWMVGDAPRDVQAGRAAGCRTVLVAAAGAPPCPQADFVVGDVSAAADIILRT